MTALKQSFNNMNKNNYLKHYHDPADYLDMKWRESIKSGFISVKDAAEISGFSRQYIYKKTVDETLPLFEKGDVKKIPWKSFVKWYSHLDETPNSPIGYASLSLKALMAYTDFERCWCLNFVKRYNINSYYIGRLRRFNKEEVQKAWSIECVNYEEWLNRDTILSLFPISRKELLNAVAKHLVKIKIQSSIVLYNQKDIKTLLKGGVCRYE